MGAYKSLYTGHEVDLALGRLLGNRYREGINPGCHLCGEDLDSVQNLFELQSPGKYTVRFYTDRGPDKNPIYMPWQKHIDTTFVSPIFLQVSIEGNSLWQRIYIGATLYYRDLQSGDYEWKNIDLGVQATEIINNLKSERTDAALSANMGRVLKNTIDNLTIGNINLISNSGLVRSSEGWNWVRGITKNTNVVCNNRYAFTFDGSICASETDYLTLAVRNAYCAEALYGSYYTSTVLVRSTTTNEATVFIQITIEDANHQTLGGNKTEVIIKPSTGWQKISVTTKNEKIDGKFIKIAFGVTKKSVADFALPKLEWGVYGTQWMPSYYDMWSEFDNANFINEIPVDIENIDHQQGIIYDEAKKCFVNEYVAIGGGGGFVQSITPPADPHVLWFKVPKLDSGYDDLDIGIPKDNRYDFKLYRYAGLLEDSTDMDDWNHKALDSLTDDLFYDANRDWVKVVPPAYAYYGTDDWFKFEDLDRAWLNKDTEDEYHPATLNYYDTANHRWRPIGAAPAVNWEFGSTPPVDTEKMWIQTPQFVLKFYYDGAWVPIHAIWGENIKDNPITT